MNKARLKALEFFWEKKSSDELSNILILKNMQKDEPLEVIGEGYMDRANVFIFVPKKQALKKFIQSNFDVEPSDGTKLISDFNYRKRIKKGEKMYESFTNKNVISAYFNGEYFNKIMLLLSGYETIKIKMNNDSPIYFECDDFYVVLAPRYYDATTKEKTAPF